MTNDVTITAQDIAKVIPNCPSCGSAHYYSVMDNTRRGFRLTTLRCEACKFDVLAAFTKLQPASRSRVDLRLVIGAIACLAIVEMALLVEIFLLE